MYLTGGVRYRLVCRRKVSWRLANLFPLRTPFIGARSLPHREGGGRVCGGRVCGLLAFPLEIKLHRRGRHTALVIARTVLQVANGLPRATLQAQALRGSSLILEVADFAIEDVIVDALGCGREAKSALQLGTFQCLDIEGHLRGAVVTVVGTIDVPAGIDDEAEDQVHEVVMTADGQLFDRRFYWRLRLHERARENH